MTGHIIDELFAWAPLAVFIVVYLIVYAAKRNEGTTAAAAGKTYACAQCGRRGKHEHMVPVSREGAVLWYCGRCAQTAH